MEKKIIKCMLDLGEALLASGAEINRVEDSLYRVGKAFGLQRVDVFVLTTVINLTITYGDGTQETQTRRFLKGSSTNFDRMEKLNSLCRSCANMSIYEFEEKLRKITAEKSRKVKLFIGSMIAAFAFALFFGGNVIDGCIAALFAFIICFAQIFFASISPNKVFFYFITALICGIGIYALKIVLPMLNVDKVIIGDIMLLIPGVAVTNAIRDIVIGDTVSGLIKLAESLLWAVALAGGFMLAMGIMGGIVV